jgi:flagellar biosynthetic protein FliP
MLSTLKIGLFLILSFILPAWVQAQGLPSVSVSMGGSTNPEQISTTLQILLMVTILTIAPAILITMTSFTRFIIVFSLLRQAMGVQNVPPNQILVGLALFMSMAVMAPTIKEINDNALQPYIKNQILQEDAIEAALSPLRSFMFKHTREKDLALFISISGDERPEALEDISTANLIPSFIISELKTAFQIGFMIYIPFLVIDIVVASILLAMGMLVLPPVIISLPFKLMLFVLVDGWNLITGSLVKSFGVVL